MKNRTFENVKLSECFSALGIVLLFLAWSGVARAQGTWTLVNNVPAGANPSTCILLTDATVMCQAQEGGNGWLRLTPDNTGSYENGKWTPLDNAPLGTDSTNITEATPQTCAPCLYSPTYFASAVLPDGRVVVIGGEYNVNSTGTFPAWSNIGFLFDPTKPPGSQWSAQLTNPFGYGITSSGDTVGCTGDSQSVVTQTGTMLIADICGFSPENGQIASFNPATLTFTAISTTGKNGSKSNDEEGWTILPGGNIFSVDANAPNNSEILNPTTNIWGSNANTAGIDLADIGGNCNSHELGPAVQLANGTIIQFSGGPSGQNAVYTISGNTWATSPGFNFPTYSEDAGTYADTVADGPASLLVNGHALVMASPGCVAFSGGKFGSDSPSHFYEFDGTSLTNVTPTSPGTNGPNAPALDSFTGRMLLLPSGRVLVTHRGDSNTDVWTYTPTTGSPLVYPNGGPEITTPPPSVIGVGQTYSISGQMFNGFSQGAAYGDDVQNATNWPLVQITNTGSGHVLYARTHDHSRMGVEAVGDPEIVSTNFDVTANIELGPSTLVVVTNGIPSASVPVTVELGSSLKYTGATTGDYNDAVTLAANLTDPATGLPIAGKTVTFTNTFGAASCSPTTDASGNASCSVTPTDAAGPYHVTATFLGDATYAGSSITVGFTVTLEDSQLTITGPVTSDYHDAVSVKAHLIDPDQGTVIPGKTVTFVLGSGVGTETCMAATDGSGNATCSITPNQAAGPYPLTATFTDGVFYKSASASATFMITKEETTTAFTASSPTVIANGHPVTFSATLLEDGTTPPVPFGQTVTFTLGTGGTAQACNGTTNATGLASCTIASVNQPLGPNTVGVAFAGDAYYQPSSASEPVIDFAFLSQGSMIIGDLDDATGTAVDFWGSMWSTLNSLSGGPAPAAFKGFADTAPQSCGGAWSARTGNSSAPPPPVLPSYMGVIASSAAGQFGNTISGNDPVIVVVQTNPGYTTDPGHPGTGTVVATYCHP
jgi:hypothetical protein